MLLKRLSAVFAAVTLPASVVVPRVSGKIREELVSALKQRGLRRRIPSVATDDSQKDIYPLILDE